MLASPSAIAPSGIDAAPAEVEVHVAALLPKMGLVGLLELAVRKSVHRIERAVATEVQRAVERADHHQLATRRPAKVRGGSGG
jgi:hypothetical protein